MDYGKILKQSVELTWRNKLLWVLGILVGLFSGGVSSPTSSSRYSTDSEGLSNLFDGLRYHSYGLGARWDRLAALGIGIVLLIMVVLFVLWVASTIIRYTSEGALIAATDDLDRGRKPTFRQSFGLGWGRFLRLFAQDLIIGVVSFVIVLVLLLAFALVVAVVIGPGVLLINAGQGIRAIGIVWVVMFGLVLAVALILLLLAFGAIYTVVRNYAARASVLKLQGVFEALSGALALFRGTWRQSVTMWLWLALISLGVGLALVPIVLLLIAAVAAPSAGVYFLSGSPALTALIAIPLYIVAALLSLWLTGLLTAFDATVWTLTYNELMAEPDGVLPPVEA